MIQTRLRRRRAWPLLAAVLLSAGGADAGAQDRVALDRWLVSTAFPADTAGDPLQTDYLAAPGEVGVLPDRGRTVAGADWTLVRRDSVLLLDLEPHRGEAGDGPVAVYAHAYVRSTEDRTLWLEWEGIECTTVQAWLNGRSLAGFGGAGLVRIGRGYNTLLLKAVSADCRFGLSASLRPAPGETLQGIRVQASRPYGDTRTGPSPWLIAEPGAGPEPLLGWKEDRLFGAAGVRVTAFAVTAIEGAKFRAKTGGEEVKRQIEWLTPAEPQTVLMPFAFKTLHRAVVRGEGLELELDWSDGKSKSTLRFDPDVLLDAFHSSIRLLGWAATGPASDNPPRTDFGIFDADDEPHPLANLIALPETAGITLVGEWEVPGWLSGFTLRLEADGSPGAYRLGSMPVDGESIILCAGCRKGQRVQLEVRTTGAWERFPGVRIAGLAEPAVERQRDAVEWLTLLDENGSRRYREHAGASGR